MQINKSLSNFKVIEQGIPQRSVLRPVFFSIYSRKLSPLIKSHQIVHHQFADDGQAWKILETITENVNEIVALILKIKAWFKTKYQKLNEGKRKIMVCGTRRKLATLKQDKNLDFIKINDYKVKVLSEVRDLGIQLDERLTLGRHINKIIKSCNQQLRNIFFIRRYLTTTCRKMFVVNQVLSRLDYWNALFANLPNYLLRKIQMLLNRAARLVYGATLTDRVTPLLIKLHWLPIKARIMYKICSLTHNMLLTYEPRYLSDKLTQNADLQGRRTRNVLAVPTVKTNQGKRTFSYCAPVYYNKLPISLSQIEDIKKFRK